MSNHRKIKLLLALAMPMFLWVLSYRCATIGRPTGGDKDSLAPEVVFIDPPQKTVNYNAKRINIRFNEYVQIKNLDRELVISPPVEKKPEIRIRGKGIYFDLGRHDLYDSTTYVFSFGNAIADLNEGNILDFTYVFSTGPVIDSFSISGKITEAFTLQPSKDFFWVMLYDNHEDSVPYKEKPLFTGRSDPQGQFEINYIRPGTYKLFALRDKNFNFLYDRKDEMVAFTDSLIVLSPESFVNLEKPLSLPDSVTAADTLAMHPDTMAFEKTYGLHLNLFAFLEKPDDTLQYIRSRDFVENRMIALSFNQAVTDTFHIMLLDYPDKEGWNFITRPRGADSVNIWITDTFLLAQDSLNVAIQYMKPDTAMVLFLSTDTFHFRKRMVTTSRHRRREEDGEISKAATLEVKVNVAAQSLLGLDKKVEITSVTPFLTYDTSQIKLWEQIDTLLNPVAFTIQPDTSFANKLYIDFALKENASYRLQVYDSAFFDIYHLANDTLKTIHFKTRALDAYGILYLTVNSVQNQVIVQLLNEKENILRENILIDNQVIEYRYLDPGKYKLKLIYDMNQNGKWDTGNYLKGLQPEKVKYFSEEIEIRPNWEHSETWDIQ